jgi:hypothetical protein
MVNAFNPAPQVTGTTGVDGTNKDKLVQVGALQVGSTTITEDELTALDASGVLYQGDNATNVGALATAPLVGSVAATIARFGKFFTIDFTLTGAQIPVTDAAASGSSGSLKLFTFAEGSIAFLGCRQNYTAFDESDLVEFTGDTTDTSPIIENVSDTADLYVGQIVTGSGIAAASRILSIDSATQITLTEDATATAATVALTSPALTGGASGGDASFKMALGTAAANAGDAALTGTEVDVGAITAALTNTAGTTTGTLHSATAAAVDGTTTPVDIYLNWSGSAATIDASGTIRVTGTITVVGVFMGDD